MGIFNHRKLVQCDLLPLSIVLAAHCCHCGSCQLWEICKLWLPLPLGIVLGHCAGSALWSLLELSIMGNMQIVVTIAFGHPTGALCWQQIVVIVGVVNYGK